MPRTARKKNDFGIYHIMVRSISDVSLFRNNIDKDKYLELIKKIQQQYLFKVYSYCLMSTHAHIIIDCAGADISNIMASINLRYAIYFNNKYDRHGHVFQDRFLSKIVTDDIYLLKLSAYIHSNPKDIGKYKKCLEKYKYSSLGVFLDIEPDSFGVLDCDFVMQHFGNSKSEAQKRYLDFVNLCSENKESSFSEEIEFTNNGSEYRSERTVLIRNRKAEDIIAFITKYTKTPFSINIKYKKKNNELKAVCMAIMRSLCNFPYKEIGRVAGNVTLSTIWRLCDKGFKLITEDERYKFIFRDILNSSFSS